MRPVLFLFLFLVISPLYGFGEDVDLGRIVITPSGVEEPLEESFASAYIIDYSQIRDRGFLTAGEAVRMLPGVFITKFDGYSRSNINIRGFGDKGRKIAVLIDGRPVKMSLFGCTITQLLSLDNAQRVEVVEGPSSVLYGSDALGGAINILTYEPRKPQETHITISGGSFSAFQEIIKQGARFKKWHYYFTLRHITTDGDRENSGYQAKDVTCKAKFQLSPQVSLKVLGKYYYGKKEDPGPLNSPTPQQRRDYQRNSIDVDLSVDSEYFASSLKYYYNWGHHQFSEPDVWHSKDYTHGLVWRINFREFARNTFLVGFDWRIQRGKKLEPATIYYIFGDTGKYKKKEYAFYAFDRFKPWDFLVLSCGLRYNKDSSYGDIIVPHIGVNYRPQEDLILRFSCDKGFRSPQLNELYMFPASTTVLEPEEVWNYELGLTKFLSSGAKIELNQFFINAKNLIETGQNTSPPPQYRFYNTAKAYFWGTELGLSFNIFKNLESSLYYIYFHSGRHTAQRPEHKIDINVALSLTKNLKLALNIQRISGFYYSDNFEDKLPNYWLAGLNLSYNKGDWEFFFNIDNLFDQDYLLEPGYPMPKINFQSGIKLHF